MLTSRLPEGWHSVTPRIVVDDPAGMVEFLRRAFDATGQLDRDRPAVMRIGDSVVMISGVGPRPATIAFVYLYVDDADATHRRALRAGARSLEEPADTPYGDRRGMVEDRWGNVWQIATPIATPENPVSVETVHVASASASDTCALNPVGVVRSPLLERGQAPKQGNEGAPDAWIEVEPSVADAIGGLRVGDEIVVITWLHRAKRDVLEVHPRADTTHPLTGVFATRSPDRPNPLGLHRVAILAIEGTDLKVGPIEAIDGTPVIDIKPVLSRPIPSLGDDS